MTDRHIDYDQPKRPRRIPPPVDAGKLLAIAQDYVSRFWGPSANLRRVLERHVQRSMRDHGSDPDVLHQAVNAIVTQMVDARAVDDRRFAELRAATLVERGTSRRMVAQKLRQKGLGADDVAHALQELQDNGGDLAAARKLVLRRKLGYLRPIEERKLKRDKDLGVLVRAGFAFDVAKRALAGAEDD